MKILFITPLPPPVHGSAMVSQYIKDSRLVNEQHDCDFVNLSTSRRMDEIGKGGIKKLLRFVGAYLTLLWKLLTRRYDLCYLAITCHGVGFLKDAPFVLLCKLFRRKVMIHQHNKGMSRYVDRWPYRWLLPLVYRNTRVMLLSWHLYDDIAAVVKREQVVVCANGVPPLQDVGHWPLAVGSSEDDNAAAELQAVGHWPLAVGSRDDDDDAAELQANSQAPSANSQAPFSHADCTDSFSCQRDSHANLDTITQNTPCFARVGHPEGDGAAELQANSQGLCQRARCKFTYKSLSECSQSSTTELLTANSQAPSAKRQAPSAKILFLSNLIPSKGVYVLLDACRVLKERGLAFICDFVGGETKEISAEVFREAVAARGLEEHVTYHGPKYGEEKHRFFMNADVFVFPTFYFNECFPLVLLEAMQWRLPLVSSDEGGIPDIVQDGVNGFVSPRQDVDSLVNALEHLITNPALRQQMGEAGYQRYCEEFTLEAFEKRFAAELRAFGC